MRGEVNAVMAVQELSEAGHVSKAITCAISITSSAGLGFGINSGWWCLCCYGN